MKEEKIISALIGLVGACDNNPKTDNTDHIVVKALAFPSLYPSFDDKMLQEMLAEIYAEKNAVAPDCARCEFPCGNTSDYDMSRLYKAGADIRECKLKILSEIEKLAADTYQDQGTHRISDIDIFYKALAYISYDPEKETLLQLLNEIESKKQKIENGGDSKE